MIISRYLSIHFAPSMACVTLEISEGKYQSLVDAMSRHHGTITLRVSDNHEITTKMVP